jgi:dolichol kinase
MANDLTITEEIQRKLVHVLTGIVGVAGGWWIENAYGFASLQAVLLVLLLLTLVLDYFRTELHINVYVFGFMERNREFGQLHAVTHALMGSLIALSLFPQNVAVAAILMFFLGDAAAAVVGKAFGAHKLVRHKTVQGSIAMLIVSAAVGLWLLPVSVALAMAFTATIVEALVEAIDDSLVIILFAGFVGAVLSGLL